MTPTEYLQNVQPLPPISRMAFMVADAILGWEVRRKTRRKLASLDSHLLKDIGISAQKAQAESEKPFWRS